jgi:hypothetical protein
MARKPSKSLGTRIPADWRHAVPSWPIWAMLEKIPCLEYEATARAFEAHHRGVGTVSDDWTREFKAWCRNELITRFERERKVVGLFGD